MPSVRYSNSKGFVAPMTCQSFVFRYCGRSFSLPDIIVMLAVGILTADLLGSLTNRSLPMLPSMVPTML